MIDEGRIMFEYERMDMAKMIHTIMTRNDTNMAGGNFSFKVVDETGRYGEVGKQYIIMTPTLMSQSYNGEVSAAQVLVVEPHTRKILAGDGQLTREINMHEAAYDAHPDIRCVLHSHAKDQLVWSTMGVPIPNLTEVTQMLKGVPALPFRHMCSEELADVVSRHLKEVGDDALTHEYLLNSHGILVTVGGKDMSGISALHTAAMLVDTMEWNAHIAMEQTKLIHDGLLDGYYSCGVKIGTLDDVFKDKKALYNTYSQAELEAVAD